MFINCVQYCLLFIKCTTFIHLLSVLSILYVIVFMSVSELISPSLKHADYKSYTVCLLEF